MAEYKCPKGSHNPCLNSDFAKYGFSNFEFLMLEECSASNLSERESYYIRQLKPYYNVIGKPLAQSVKDKISDTNKENWKNLPLEKQRKIVANNLTGPKKGHEVSEITRNKLRQANLGKKVLRPVVIMETGQEFINAVECAEFLGVTHSTVCYNLRGQSKKTKCYTIRYK